MDLTVGAKNIKLDALSAVVTHVSLHTAYPGSTGTDEVAGGTYARVPVTWDAASGGSVAASAALDFNVPASTTVAWSGLFSALTVGTFYGAIPLGPASDPRLAVALLDDTFTISGHGFANGDSLAVAKTLGSLPTGITDGQVVFARDVTTNTFKVAATLGGSAIDLTGGGVALVRKITTETFGGAGTLTITSAILTEG